MPPMTVKLKIENLDLTIDAAPGDNLRDALMEHDVEIYQPGLDRLANCHGKAMCGTCQIEVVEGPGLSDMSLYEKMRLRVQDIAERFLSGVVPFINLNPACSRPNRRLACQARIYQDTTIRTMVDPPEGEE